MTAARREDVTATEGDGLLSGDDLERIEAGAMYEDHEPTLAARTALHHRQEAMDLRDEVTRLRRLVGEACQHLDHAGFCVSADRFRAALSQREIHAWRTQLPRCRYVPCDLLAGHDGEHRKVTDG